MDGDGKKALEEIGKNLKACLLAVTTASVNKRKELFGQDLVQCIENPALQENFIKGIAKIASHTIIRYRDSASRHVVQHFIKQFLAKHGAVAAKYLLVEMHAICVSLVKYQTSMLVLSCASTMLIWCREISSTGLLAKDVGADFFRQLVEVEALCYSIMCSLSTKSARRYRKSAEVSMKSGKTTEIMIKYLDVIINNEKYQIESLCVVGFIFQYLTAKKQISSVEASQKKSLIDMFVQNCIQTKTMAAKHCLENAKPMLKYITHAEFAEVLPVIQKALLRNPETVLEAIGLFLNGLSIDLSKYIDDLSKCIGSHLISQNALLRSSAVAAIEYVTVQCSDAEAVKVLMKHLLKILGGSEGKLTNFEQRSAVIQAISAASKTTVSGSQKEELAIVVFDGLSSFLLQEANEVVLTQALETLKTWSEYFISELPASFMESIKKGLATKTSTPAIRVHYLQVASHAIKGNTLKQGEGLLEVLKQIVEKTKTQSHQLISVYECLAASTLIAKMVTSDDIQDAKIDSFWNSILDPAKKPLLSEKFLQAAEKEHLEQLFDFMNILFLHHQEVLLEKGITPWFTAFVLLLLHADWTIKKKTRALLRKIFEIGLFDPKQLQSELMNLLYQEVVNEQVLADSDSVDKNLAFVNNIIQTYLFVCSCGKNDPEQSIHLLMNCLTKVHHPRLFDVCEDIIHKIASCLGVDLKVFFLQMKEDIIDMIMKKETLDQETENTLKTLVCHSPEVFLPPFLDSVAICFNDHALNQVTEHEFGILNTPDGEVYDQSIYQSAKAAEKTGNVKRESKAYSFKEQKEEMELREELRKKHGETSKGPELNKKQKEQLQILMKQEQEIRNRLKQLENILLKHCTIFSVCLSAKDINLTLGFGKFINYLLQLCRSILAAPHVVRLFIKLSQSLFKDDLKYLGEFIGYTVLRHKEPRCNLTSGWCEEKLSDATKRVLQYLHSFIFEQNMQLMMTYTWKMPFSAPAFAYCLPLLKTVLKDRGSYVAHDEQKRMNALQIVLAHSKLRSQDNNGFDENGPDLLPRAEMLNILSEVIVTCEGHNKDAKIQVFANSVFDEVCKAGSGNEGCAEATKEEIELLVANVLSDCSMLRNASLKGLLEMVKVLTANQDEKLLDLLTRRVMIARYGMVEDNTKLAEKLWEDVGLCVSEILVSELVEDVLHPLADVRHAASLALAAAFSSDFQHLSSNVVQKLLTLYEEKTKIPPPVIDNLGRAVSSHFVDPWEARQGIGLGLEKIAPYVDEDQLETLFRFFVPTALGDRHDSVRKQMLDAAMQCINHFGQDHMTTLLGIFQEFLDQAPDSSAHDTIRQSVIILTGSLAKHLAKTDPQIKPIFSKLMDALSTPSQQVQQAVANCLPPLCAAVKEEAAELIKDLVEKLLDAESYGERRGAAYGLAGLVKGLGILSLKQQNIISTLNEAIQDKKVWKHREGALFAFETLCTMLGRLFEPYVVHLLPHLLLCFGDGNQYVREAADETAKAVMKNLSNHGVKLVLPSLLKALEEESWRTKTGSAELLGAMSFCAPKQLSSCLPSIVPRLQEVLADSHLKVQKAGQQALRQIGGVIRNPEIQEIADIILDALTDPNQHTVACLQALLSTSFVHFIDAPSLSLIMPTLEKALDQRPMETKKMAAQILGNMYELTDPKDLSPYLPAVVPGLKKSLLDPSPEVRSVSARALGAIVRGMGEECFNDLMPWLLETLTSEVSSVDRSGAAQGLAEVLHALGKERLDKLMPDVIATTIKLELAPNIRDGYLMLYIYLPATFGDDFIEYIGLIIPPILKGLADESEYVRDTSLKAGQRIINMYSDSAIELLLPQLEAGLFDEHWRIRYSSVQLLGDLLFRLSGVTGKQSTVGDEDDNFGTAHSAQVILRTFGAERRNRVYAGLYMGRSDVALTVRQSALHVWKVIVQNTAKTLREILPTLFELLLGSLACQNHDKRQIAARTLGDLVRKLGERILPEIIPILENSLDNPDGNKRQGVCIGLSEIMDSTSRDMIAQFEDSLIMTVRKALVDELPDVRHAASITFENLHNTIGHRALDGVLPDVFTKLDDPTLSEYALDGLKQVMAVKSKSVLPFLVPKLTTPPVNTKALAILSSVAGEALVKHLEKILPAMIQAVYAENENASEAGQEKMAFEGTRTLILSVEDEVGVRTIVDELLAATKNQNPGIRNVAGNMLAVFCKDSKCDYGQYVQQLFRYIILLMNDVDDKVVLSGWSTLDALVKHLDPSEQIQHLPSLRQALRFVKDDIRGAELPGFCILKKGITPVLPIFREGILNGSQEIKEQASNVLSEVIKLTSAAALKPSVIHITGPLIRILGDRFNANVKVAILDTLGLLLSKVGIMLKPFQPQLQTTFIKALNDPTMNVRSKAAWALGLLTILLPPARVDSLFTELRNGITNNEDDAIRETILQALRTITINTGAKMGEAIRKSLLEMLVELLDSNKDELRVKAGAALGALCKILPEDDMKQLLKGKLLNVDQTMDWTVCHGRAVALSYALYDAPSNLFSAVDEDEIVGVVVQHSSNDRVPVCTYGVHSLGHLLLFSKENADAAPSIVISSVKKSLTNASPDVKLTALSTLKHVAKNQSEVLAFDRVRYVIPEFIALLKDRNSAVRACSELTLAFVLQLHRNDTLFDEITATIPEVTNFLEDYRKNAFSKLSDSLATDEDDYPFVT